MAHNGVAKGRASHIRRQLRRRYLNSGTHLLGLINEILDLPKLEAGQLELHEQPIDLAATIEACMNPVEKAGPAVKDQNVRVARYELPLDTRRRSLPPADFDQSARECREIYARRRPDSGLEFSNEGRLGDNRW
jgi:signal transduction histidine kinase